MTFDEEIADIDRRQADATVKLRESYDLRDAATKDIVAWRALSMRLRQERLAKVDDEQKRKAFRLADAMDKKTLGSIKVPTAADIAKQPIPSMTPRGKR